MIPKKITIKKDKDKKNITFFYKDVLIYIKR